MRICPADARILQELFKHIPLFKQHCQLYFRKRVAGLAMQLGRMSVFIASNKRRNLTMRMRPGIKYAMFSARGRIEFRLVVFLLRPVAIRICSFLASCRVSYVYVRFQSASLLFHIALFSANSNVISSAAKTQLCSVSTLTTSPDFATCLKYRPINQSLL